MGIDLKTGHAIIENFTSLQSCSAPHLQLQSYKSTLQGARCSSMVRAFAHGAMGCWIDPSWGGPIELFLVPASAPRLV